MQVLVIFLASVPSYGAFGPTSVFMVDCDPMAFFGSSQNFASATPDCSNAARIAFPFSTVSGAASEFTQTHTPVHCRQVDRPRGSSMFTLKASERAFASKSPKCFASGLPTTESKITVEAIGFGSDFTNETNLSWFALLNSRHDAAARSFSSSDRAIAASFSSCAARSTASPAFKLALLTAFVSSSCSRSPASKIPPSPISSPTTPRMTAAFASLYRNLAFQDSEFGPFSQ